MTGELMPKCPYCGMPVDETLREELDESDSLAIDCECGQTFQVNIYCDGERREYEVERL